MSQIGQEFSADLVVVSDIHIREPGDKRALLLEDLCTRVARGQVGHFVLLGDIFDFFLGRHPYFAARYARLGRSLENIAASGTNVVFFEGNHEFDLCRVSWDGVNIVSEGSQIIEMNDETKFLMAHGDLVYSSRSYRIFRRLVKSWPSRFIAGLTPGRLLESFALGNAKASRAADQYRNLEHTDVLKTMNTWASQHQCHHAVFGHLHYPYYAPRVDSAGKIVSLNSWDLPNVLVYRNAKFWRVFPDATNQHWSLVPAKTELGTS